MSDSPETVQEGVIKTYGRIGLGDEARVLLQLRTQFPGIGGTIVTSEGVVAALREEYHPFPKAGHSMFLKHAIIKKLEDFFFRSGAYIVAHIPRPFGSVSVTGEKPYEAYFYEFAFGQEGFPWQLVNPEGGRDLVQLQDWNMFATSFYSAGIDVTRDKTDPNDGRISKNIIHIHPVYIGDGFELSDLWKRIDFGDRSINIDYERLFKFLQDKRADLGRMLRSDRYEMLVLAARYLAESGRIREVDIGRLEILVGAFRRSSLDHFAKGSGSLGTPTYSAVRTETLL